MRSYPQTDQKLRKVQVCVKLPRWLKDWTAKQAKETGISRAVQIEEAMKDYYEIEGPEVDK